MLKLGALLFAAAVAASVPIPIPKPSQQAPQTPQIQSEQQAKNAVGRQERGNGPISTLKNRAGNNDDHKRGEHASEITFLGIRIGEILLAFVTFLLWWSTQSLVREAKASSERQLRAYVSGMPLKISALDEGKTIVLHTFFQNHGKTPSYGTVDWSDVRVMPYPMLKELTINTKADANNPRERFDIFPGAQHKVTHQIILTDAEKDLLNTGNFGLYCFGKITYKDAFGAGQWTEYCTALIEPELSSDIAVAKAQVPIGKSIPAGFRFTPFNNRASVRGGRKKWWQRN